MSRQTLRAVTLQTVATATQAAEATVGAYRAGGHRLVAVIQQRVAAPTVARTQPYAPRLASALGQTSSRAGRMADQGIDLLSDRTEQAISVAAKGVTAQVKRVAQLAEGVDNRVLASGLDTAARITLPGAQAALALTERLADGAGKLARSAAGPKAARAKTAKAAKAAPKAATKAPAKAPARRAAAAKPATPLAEVVKAAAKPVRRAVKAVAQPAAPKTVAKAPAKPRAARRPAAAPVVSAAPATEAAAA
ncbi:hypothetical protein AACH10_02750 [Ideonella sp. DXS22W]|uniref:Phasin domain-containing protein n=1 Tax=Pseudaquabacterium inlustre TaxID=2984192 RepID=A0ABU9CBB4_9BURK